MTIKNQYFDALRDICGFTMSAFLDNSRRHNNPMFDIVYININLLDKLEVEYHQRNSVWHI